MHPIPEKRLFITPAPDSGKWKDLGVVIGQDGPAVFVRRVPVHLCRITKTTPSAEGNTRK